MSNFNRRKARMIVLCIGLVLLVLSVTACAPKKSESGSTTGNVTAVKGTLEVYDPTKDAAAHTGNAIEGSDEEKLQQERIAGGAVGAVVSQNLEPLTGITDYSKGTYVDSYGIDTKAPAGHGAAGNCQACHSNGGTAPQEPANHATAKLQDGDCTTCHK